MKNILIVDDDSDLRAVLKTYISGEGYSYEEAATGDKALDILAERSFDLVILDVMMPGIDGYETLERLRRNLDTPVILLTARKEEYDKLKGFNVGADDYISKPFSPKELMARVKAILRRGRTLQTGPLIFGDLEINEVARSVTVRGEKVTLTFKEYELLLYLAQNIGIALDREAILRNVWGYDYYGDTRTVDTHIKSLRERLGPTRELIQTVWGVGYKFDSE